MTPETFAHLQRECRDFLAANNTKPKTKAGAKMIHTFWFGALSALKDPDCPAVVIRMLSGRFDELVAPEEN